MSKESERVIDYQAEIADEGNRLSTRSTLQINCANLGKRVLDFKMDELKESAKLIIKNSAIKL